MVRTTTIKQQIIALLGITEQAYTAIVEQLGYNFAWHYTMHHAWSVEYLTKTAAYWKWWNNQQYLRDEMFLTEMEDYRNTGSEVLLMELWLDNNSPEEIEGKPPKRALDASYQLMLQAVDKEREGRL